MRYCKILLIAILSLFLVSLIIKRVRESFLNKKQKKIAILSIIPISVIIAAIWLFWRAYSISGGLQTKVKKKSDLQTQQQEEEPPDSTIEEEFQITPKEEEERQEEFQITPEEEEETPDDEESTPEKEEEFQSAPQSVPNKSTPDDEESTSEKEEFQSAPQKSTPEEEKKPQIKWNELEISKKFPADVLTLLNNNVIDKFALLDVDQTLLIGTAYASFSLQFSKRGINKGLINALKLAGITNVCFFTKMGGPNSFSKEKKPKQDFNFRRIDIIEYMESLGFTVWSVMTTADTTYGKGLGQFYHDWMSKEHDLDLNNRDELIAWFDNTIRDTQEKKNILHSSNKKELIQLCFDSIKDYKGVLYLIDDDKYLTAAPWSFDVINIKDPRLDVINIKDNRTEVESSIINQELDWDAEDEESGYSYIDIEKSIHWTAAQTYNANNEYKFSLVCIQVPQTLLSLRQDSEDFEEDYGTPENIDVPELITAETQEYWDQLFSDTYYQKYKSPMIWLRPSDSVCISRIVDKNTKWIWSYWRHVAPDQTVTVYAKAVRKRFDFEAET